MVKYNNKIYRHTWQAIVIVWLQVLGGAALLALGMFSTMMLLWMIGG